MATYILNYYDSEWKLAVDSNGDIVTNTDAEALLNLYIDQYPLASIRISHLQDISASYTITPTA